MLKRTITPFKQWKTGSVLKQGITQRDQILRLSQQTADTVSIFDNHTYSVHHKISRYNLAQAYKIWLNNGCPDGSFKKALELCEQATKAKGLKALQNAPFNLELGPAVQKRYKDPGKQFDPNYGSDGRLTPRSHALQRAKNSQAWQFEKVGKALITAYEVHQDKLGYNPSEISPPHLEQWQLDKSSGKWLKASAV